MVGLPKIQNPDFEKSFLNCPIKELLIQYTKNVGDFLVGNFNGNR